MTDLLGQGKRCPFVTEFYEVCKPQLRKELKTFGVGDYIGQENSNRVHLVSTLGKCFFSAVILSPQKQNGDSFVRL